MVAFFQEVDMCLREFWGELFSVADVDLLPFFPAKFGGMGFSNPILSHRVAYISSVMECMTRFGWGDWDVVVEWKADHDLHLIPEERPKSPLTKLQSKFMESISLDMFKEYLSTLGEVRRAEVLGGAGDKQGLWVFGGRGRNKILDEEFRNCVCLRLGYPLSPDLQANFDGHFSSKYSSPSQLLGVSVGGGTIARHNSLRNYFRDWAGQMGYVPILEPVVGLEGDERLRADLKLVRDDEDPVFIDFFFTTSSMPSYARIQSFSAPEQSLRRKMSLKLSKYDKLVKGLGGRFLPLGFDSLGRYLSSYVEGLGFLLKRLESWKKDHFWRGLSLATARRRSWTLENVILNTEVVDGVVVKRVG